MAKIRVGFIGGGRIADLHAAAYRDNPDAELYAVCDVAEDTARRRAEEWGATRWYTDYRQLLADKAVDAVEILTPHHLHAEMAVAALEAGKHVSLQKPHTLNLTEMDQVIAAAQRSGKLFRVCENFRYYPPYNKARQLMDEGAIGEPISIRVKVLSGSPRGGWPVSAETWQWHFTEAQVAAGSLSSTTAITSSPSSPTSSGRSTRCSPGSSGRKCRPAWCLMPPPRSCGSIGEGMRYGTWETIRLARVGDSHQVLRRRRVGRDHRQPRRDLGEPLLGEMLEGPAVVLYRDGETRAFDDLETDWGVSFVRRGRTSSPPSARDAPALSRAPRHDESFSSPWPSTARPGGAAGAGRRDRGLEPVRAGATRWRTPLAQAKNSSSSMRLRQW